MNEEIKALIERERYNYHSENARAEIDNFEYEGTITTDQAESCLRTAETDGFQAGVTLALSLFKWRKVSEELPEIGEKILIRNSKRITTRRFYHISEIELCIKTGLITEWMPIPEGGCDE